MRRCERYQWKCVQILSSQNFAGYFFKKSAYFAYTMSFAQYAAAPSSPISPGERGRLFEDRLDFAVTIDEEADVSTQLHTSDDWEVVESGATEAAGTADAEHSPAKSGWKPKWPTWRRGKGKEKGDGNDECCAVGEDEWVADDVAHNCAVCTAEFGLTRWKHHCRICGRVVCDACSRERVTAEKLRACTACIEDDDAAKKPWPHGVFRNKLDAFAAHRKRPAAAAVGERERLRNRLARLVSIYATQSTASLLLNRNILEQAVSKAADTAVDCRGDYPPCAPPPRAPACARAATRVLECSLCG